MIGGLRVIQVIGVLLGLVIIYEARVLFRKGQFKERDVAIWGFIAVVLIVVSVFQIFDYLTAVTRMGRGLDVLLILGLFGCYAMVFQTYVRIQETNRQVTELVRQIALKIKEKK